MRIGALIPAKLTSTRLKRKNLLPLNGKPLLYWSVKSALDADIFCDVTVSSEDDEVLDVVRKHFSASDVHCLKRPKEMSSKYASLRDVMRHYIETAGELDYFSLFMPTSPFRNPERIRTEIAPHLYTGRIERVISLDSLVTPTIDYFVKEPDGRYAMVFLPNIQYCYHCNSTYLVSKVDGFFSKLSLRGNESLLRIGCSFNESVNIDTHEDYELALKVSAYGEPRFHTLVSHKVGDCSVTLPKSVDLDSFLSVMDGTCLKEGRLKIILGRAPNLFTLLDIQQAIEQGMQGMPFYLNRRHELSALEHSQLHPDAYLRNPYYSISSMKYTPCRWGEKSLEVDPAQVISEQRLMKWSGYVEPYYWDMASLESEEKTAV